MFVLVKWIDEGAHSIVSGSTLDRCAAQVTPGEIVKVKVFEGTKAVLYAAEVVGTGKCMNLFAYLLIDM